MHGIATRVRPRPVDNYKRLVIYRDASELQFDDDGAAELSQVRTVFEWPNGRFP